MATIIQGSADSTFGGTIESTGIDDNATSTAITINSDESVSFANAVVITDTINAGSSGSSGGTTGKINFGGVSGSIDGFTITNENGNYLNIKPNSSSNGIKILNSGGMCFGTDTATANALDDYETGTFTFSGTTIAGSSGAITWSTSSDVMAYQKIGNRVFIQGGLTVASNSTNGGRFALNGLPFASGAGTEKSSYSLLHSQVTGGTGSQASGFMTNIGPSSTDLTIQTYTGTGTTNDSAPIMAVSSVLWISGSYTI